MEPRPATDRPLSADDLAGVRGGMAGFARFRQFRQNYWFLRYDQNLGRLQALREAFAWF